MGFLRKYLETGFTSVLDQTRTVVAMNKLGYIFEVIRADAFDAHYRLNCMCAKLSTVVAASTLLA